MQKEEDYIYLLKIFADVVEANKDTPAGQDGKSIDAEGLSRKCFFHMSSLIYLWRSTNIPEFGFSFFDSGSINVIARAALESFLIFHCVFVEPTTEKEKDFRYLTWQLADLMERQRYDALSPQGKIKLEEEKTYIEKIKGKIQQNQIYSNLKNKQQVAVLEKRKWRFKTWTEIGISAGLSEDHAKSCYRFMCSYAHSGNMSVFQLNQANTAEQQKLIGNAAMDLAMITMAFFIKSYCLLFKKSKEFFEKEEDYCNHVSMWVEIGSTALKDVDVDWTKLNF